VSQGQCGGIVCATEDYSQTRPCESRPCLWRCVIVVVVVVVVVDIDNCLLRSEWSATPCST
jgi:hypothetical protein